MKTKRRKISVGEEDSELKIFRRDLLDHVNANLMEKSGKIKRNLILERLSYDRKKPVESNVEKDIRIQKYLKDKSTYLERMTKVLGTVSLSTLRITFRNHFKNEAGLGKFYIIQAFVAKFYGSVSDFMKRKMEGENIKEFEKDTQMMEELNFIVINGKTIPRDILSLIISYIPQDSELLFSLGSTCKHFYILILSSWESVEIRKSNLFQISLLVLKNVKRISIIERKNDSNFVEQELEYLCGKVNPLKLREIEFIISTSRLTYFVKTLNSLRERNFDGFQKVEKVRFVLKGSDFFEPSRNIYSAQLKALRKKNWDSSSIVLSHFHKIFPNIRCIEYPFCLDICEGLNRLDTLKLTFFQNASQLHYTPQKIEKYISPNLKTLKLRRYFDLRSKDSDAHFLQFLKRYNRNFKILENLSLSFWYPFLSNINKQNLNFPELKRFSLHERVRVFHERLGLTGLEITPFSDILKAPKLKKLKFIAFQRVLFYEFPHFRQLFTENLPDCTWFKGAFTIGISCSSSTSQKNNNNIMEDLENEDEVDFVDFFFSSIIPRFEYFSIDLKNVIGNNCEKNFRFLGEVFRIRYISRNRSLFIGISSSLDRRRRSKEWFDQRRKENPPRTRILFDLIVSKIGSSSSYGEYIQRIIITNDKYYKKPPKKSEKLLGCFQWIGNENFVGSELFDIIDVRRLYYKSSRMSGLQVKRVYVHKEK